MASNNLNQLVQNLRSSLEEPPQFRYPLPQPYPVSQRFGENPDWYRRFGISTGHNGIDYAAPAGTPVLASEGGIVVKTGFDPQGYGHYVKIAHGSSYVSLYAHLSEIQVNYSGGDIEPGQQIGLSGSSGFSTGPHLHFEIRKDNTAIDPEPLLQPRAKREGSIRPTVCTVTVPVLNIRSAPSINAPVIGQLTQDQRITILERFTTVWVKIAENAYIAHTFENTPYLDEVKP